MMWGFCPEKVLSMHQLAIIIIHESLALVCLSLVCGQSPLRTKNPHTKSPPSRHVVRGGFIPDSCHHISKTLLMPIN